MTYRVTSEILRFDNLISSLISSDRIALVHHPDPDGVCSAVLLAKALAQRRKQQIELRINQRSHEIEITEQTIALLKKNKVTHVFMTDMAVDQNPLSIKRLEGFCSVVVLDHHPHNNRITSAKTIVIKSQDISDLPPSKYCTSKLAYDLCMRKVDLSRWDWIAAIGIISDQAHMTWLSFIREVFRKHGLRMPKDIKQSELGKISTVISLVEAYSFESAKESFKELFAAASYEEVLNSSLSEIAQKVKKEVAHYVNSVKEWTMMDTDHDVLMGEVVSPFMIKSHLTGELSQKYPHKTVICYQKVGDGSIAVSAWRKDGAVKVNDLLIRATKRLSNARAGGHDTMAGATIQERDLDLFKQQLAFSLDALCPRLS